MKRQGLREVEACILGGTTAMRASAASVGIADGAGRIAMTLHSKCEL